MWMKELLLVEVEVFTQVFATQKTVHVCGTSWSFGGVQSGR